MDCRFFFLLFLKAIGELETNPDISHQKIKPIQIRITQEQQAIVPKVPKKDNTRSERKWYVQVKDTQEVIEIDLDKRRPLTFGSLRESIEWEKQTINEASKFKRLV